VKTSNVNGGTYNIVVDHKCHLSKSQLNNVQEHSRLVGREMKYAQSSDDEIDHEAIAEAQAVSKEAKAKKVAKEKAKHAKEREKEAKQAKEIEADKRVKHSRSSSRSSSKGKKKHRDKSKS